MGGAGAELNEVAEGGQGGLQLSRSPGAGPGPAPRRGWGGASPRAEGLPPRPGAPPALRRGLALPVTSPWLGSRQELCGRVRTVRARSVDPERPRAAEPDGGRGERRACRIVLPESYEASDPTTLEAQSSPDLSFRSSKSQVTCH